MHFQDFVYDAVNVVLAWDISDELFAEAVNAQAGVMARTNPEEIRVLD